MLKVKCNNHTEYIAYIIFIKALSCWMAWNFTSKEVLSCLHSYLDIIYWTTCKFATHESHISYTCMMIQCFLQEHVISKSAWLKWPLGHFQIGLVKLSKYQTAKYDLLISITTFCLHQYFVPEFWSVKIMF